MGGPYCIVNHMRADAGSLLYGDVSAVFSPARMRVTALLSAVDTGQFASLCNFHSNLNSSGKLQEEGVASPLEHNCSAFPIGPQHLGTVEDFNHLLLINERYWKSTSQGPLLRLFSRLFSPAEGT